jgi:PIN domain nuclease of toxin-antitoxin system
VIVLDASCLVSLLRGEPGQHDVVQALTTGCRMNALNRAEVIDRLARHGAVAADVAADLDTLGIEFVPLTTTLADSAARLRSQHYHPVTRPLSMADCVALATALEANASLATSDVHLATTCVEHDCSVVAVANSKGAYPLPT